jgi:isopropylmalate/homocitrate/citramalate synthase
MNQVSTWRRCCDSESYQSIAPSLMGRSYRLVLGKHSGRQAVNGVLTRWAITSTPRN